MAWLCVRVCVREFERAHERAYMLERACMLVRVQVHLVEYGRQRMFTLVEVAAEFNKVRGMQCVAVRGMPSSASHAMCAFLRQVDTHGDADSAACMAIASTRHAASWSKRPWDQPHAGPMEPAL